MENKNTIEYRIMELESQSPHARGLAELSRINHELDNLREQQSENMLLGIYDEGCTPQDYRRNFVRW